MKLTKLETYVVQNPPETTAFGEPYFYLVKLSTDEDIYGWGETATLSLYHPLQQSYKTLMDQIFDVYLKGQNALDREHLNKTLYVGLTVRHPEYSTGGLISAIDLALWDIAGKACEQPVYNLLGGAFRKKVRSYSYIYPDPQALREVFLGKRSHESLSDPKRFADTALQMVEEEFTGLKLDPVPFRDEYDLHASDFDIPHIQQNFVTPPQSAA